MEIIHQERWLRFIKEHGVYRVQVRHWWRWKDVTFGPFGPYKVGLSGYKNRSIPELHFIDCLAKGKRYALRGV